MPALIVCLLVAGVSAEEQPKKEQSKAPPAFAIVFVTIWGPDNRPLYGVPIRLERITGKKAHWEAPSNHTGEVAFRVPAGKADYLVTADVEKQKSKENKGLKLKEPARVHIEFDERVDTGLHLSK